MSEQFNPVLVERGRKYFYGSDVLTTKNSGETRLPPKAVGWYLTNTPDFILKQQAEKLLRGQSLGYGGEGTDTAKTREEYKTTFTSNNSTDNICSSFGYNEYGMGTVGKTIVDVGAGDSPFAHDMNTLWRDLGTRVIAVDPKYDPEKQNAEKLSAFAQDLGRLNALHDNKPFANEVISHYGVTLVPPQDFSHSVLEMLKICKDEGVIKIIPCHIFKKIEEFTDEQGRSRQKIGNMVVPYGATFSQRLTVDMWRFDCKKNEVDEHELGVFLERLKFPDAEKCLQFWDSTDLMHRRQSGEYVLEAMNATPLSEQKEFDFEEFMQGNTIDESSVGDVDEYGNLI